MLERYEFPYDDPSRPPAALYAPTPATYRHLGDVAALGLLDSTPAETTENQHADTTDAEFDARHADAARKAAFRLFGALHPGTLL